MSQDGRQCWLLQKSLQHFNRKRGNLADVMNNMAATKSSSIVSSSTFLNRSGNKDDLVCKRCRDREIQLKEVLDKLSSAQVIIDILQKELLSSKAVTSTCAEQQFSTKEHSSNSTTEVWSKEIASLS